MNRRVDLLPLSQCRPAWDALWQHADSATAFTTSRFALALAGATKQPCQVLALSDDDGMAAAVLVYASQFGPWARASLPTTVYYNAPLVRSGLPGNDSALADLLSELGARFPLAALQLPPSQPDCRPYSWAGFRCEVRYTFASIGSVQRDFSRAVRQRLRRHGDHYQADTATVDDPVVSRFALSAYKRDERRLPLPEPVLLDLWSRLERSGLARAFVLRNVETGEAESAQVLLDDGRSIAAWMAGSVRGPAQTICNALIAEQAESDGRMLDLLGANTPSVAEFKRAFGLPLQPFYYATRVPRVVSPLHALRRVV